MTTICSVGLGIPPYEITQEEVKDLVPDIFCLTERERRRYLPVFDHAHIDNRQLVVAKDWFEKEHTFKERNNIYEKYARKLSLEAVDHCLSNSNFLSDDVPYDAIDMIIFISSTGISTPTVDTYIMNSRPFREDIIRMPIWGLGCGGGANGLSRAADFLKAYPTKNVLIISCELCSITFQKTDNKLSNLIGTALFGDGVSAILMIGNQSEFLSYKIAPAPKVISTNTLTKKNSEDIMGWNVTNNGFEVIFSKSIPSYVQSFWKEHVDEFLERLNISKDMIHSFISHPGGKKVLDAMESALGVSDHKFKHSHNTLSEHGNMSSATVFYVLNEWMKEKVDKNELSLLTALGPGFSSDILLLRWT